MLVLHDVVGELGYVADDDVAEIADALNLSIADVYGVVTFYTDFRRTPPAAHSIALCRAEACQSVGAEALYRSTQQRFGGRDDVEVAEVFCFGNCALGPSGMIDGALRGRLDDDRIGALTAEWQA